MTEEVQVEISPDDTMYEGSREHYFAVGQSALRCVKTAMSAADRESFHNILDFGSGFGRVLRVLKATFPQARLTACDISQKAIDFCAETFGAKPVLSSEDSTALRFDQKFDLIWCGTLLTQFDAPQFVGFLNLLQSLLITDGLLVFTTHGPFVANKLRTHVGEYGLNDEGVSRILDSFNKTGFGYVDYPSEVLPRVGVTKYGFCISKPSWVCRQIESMPNMRLITYTERAWDNHQDSVACMKQ
jgi:SAM-dependent methyltransferase